MSKKKRQKGSRSRRPARRASQQSGGPTITTPEGDAIQIATITYQHDDLAEILQILGDAEDFDLDEDLDSPLLVFWFETDPDKPAQFAPIGQRILARLHLSANRLEVETMSRERLQRCRQRLEQLLGERISLARPARSKRRAARPAPQSSEPFSPPPDFIAQIEEQMLRQWIDESIPALGGLSPRQAVKTAKGRQQVLQLIEEGQEMQQRMKNKPGMFAPDYSKVKKMLDLE